MSVTIITELKEKAKRHDPMPLALGRRNLESVILQAETYHSHAPIDSNLRAGSQDFLKIKSKGFPC